MAVTEFRRAGLARHRITIVDPQGGAQSQDSYGQVTYVQTTVGSFWGFMEPATDALLESVFGQRWAEAKYMFTMRYQQGITIKREMQVLFRGKTMTILDVDDTTATNRPVTMLALRDFES